MFSAGAVRIGMQNQSAKKTGICLFFLCRLVKLGVYIYMFPRGSSNWICLFDAWSKIKKLSQTVAKDGG